MNLLFLGQNNIFRNCLDQALRYLHNKDSVVPDFIGIVGDIDLSYKYNKIKHYPIKNINIEHLKEIIISNKVDVIISIQFPKILPLRILNLVNGNAFNLHNAKLPDYRGHNSLTHEILNGETKHFVSIHKMAVEVDRGHMISKLSIPIQKNETAFSLYHKCLDSIPEFFMSFFMKLLNNTIEYKNIEGKGCYYSIKLNKEIPPNTNIDDLDKYARAFYFKGKEPAYFISNGRKVYIMPEY